jgi:hypothetical protein
MACANRYAKASATSTEGRKLANGEIVSVAAVNADSLWQFGSSDWAR